VVHSKVIVMSVRFTSYL